MKRVFLVFLLLSVACLADDKDIARELIHELPSRESLVADVELARDDQSTDPKKGEAIERLKKAKGGFDRLRTLLRPGISVFDYPGLISLARPQYDDFISRYSMIVGIPPGWIWNHPQGTNPDEYQITFNDRGIITAVDPVVYLR